MTTLLPAVGLLVLVVAAVLVVLRRAHRGQSLNFGFADLWKWQGQVGRGVYGAVGVIGFALKHNIDRAVAGLVFGRPFGIFNYWIPPVDAVRISELSRDDAKFLATMVVISLPFIWVGVTMTLRRLRSTGLPLWLVLLFFIPVLNIVFFLILAAIPEVAPPLTSGRESSIGRFIPDTMIGSASVAVVAMGAIGALVAYLGVQALGTYGLGVFVALPFCLGLGSVMIYAFHRPRNLGSCVLVSLTALTLVAAALLALAVEGLICIAMAFPIATPLAVFGGIVGYLIQRGRSVSAQVPSLMLITVFLPAGFITTETAIPAPPPAYTVTTEIRIEASPSKVWRNLIAFPDLPEPDEWLFRSGVSRPIHATIDGEGVGAIRECLFSTGTFVERIDGWEPDRRLAFSIVSAPDAMHELSPYEIHPRHLDGYFKPVRAEFTLVANSDGSTTLQGKSWYSNSMWPGMYWRLWSDKILHDVHRSVFQHLKTLAEAEN